MPNLSDAIIVDVQQAGLLAMSALETTEQGQVTAVFRSTFYVETARGLACFGNSDLESAGFNISTSAPARTDWRASGVVCGAPAHITRDAVRIGSQLTFVFSNADVWMPPEPLASIDANQIVYGLNDLRRICVGRLPQDGLARFIDKDFMPSPEDKVCRQAVAPLRQARSMQMKLFAGVPCDTFQWIDDLIGLGPGLTPSGDDFLGGVMMTLRALGRVDISDCIWSVAEPCAAKNSNPISLSHLRAASQGSGSETLHLAIAALLSADREVIRQAADRLDGIGHSSGWDTMTGVVLTLDAYAGTDSGQSFP